MSQHIVKKQQLPVGGIQYDVNHCHDDYQASLNYGAHIHNCYELYFKISGTTSFFVNNERYRVEDHCVLLTRPNEVHSCIMHTEESHEHYCLWLDLPQSLDPFYRSKGTLPCCFKLDPEHAQRFREALDRLLREDATPLDKTAAIFEILAMMEKSTSLTFWPADPFFPEEMKRILEYINKDFTTIRRVKDIYDHFYVSPATLSRWFKKYVGIAPRDFLEAQKLSYAKNLLHQGKSVAEVARTCGFQDTSYFIFVFKKSFGLTPAEFRRNRLSSPT